MRTLKTLIAAVLVSLVATSASAQIKEDAKTINLTANLNTTIALNLNTDPITFDFNTLEDYKKGLGKTGQKYASKGSVSSTANWQLVFVATDEFKHSNGKNTMPLNNVGLRATVSGQKSIKNNAYNRSLALSKKETIILDQKGNQMNAGDHKDNGFTIYWEMGTRRNDMNKKSIFDQNLKKGTYNTEVKFTAREVI
ncbi:hypothetical protein EYV94_03255 [Puteibacter caeruleilacunae]|nr:hypothetical protein EYV94_03255 [Puteibacter caeruleilacunae]